MLRLKVEDLNPEQHAAVFAEPGPVLILAGAGSGKTRVLTYRIAHLVDSGKAAPEDILAVTFTNKAAAEMRERLSGLIDDHRRVPWVSTFHSACARILRQDGRALEFNRDFSILDEADSLAVIRQVLEDAVAPDMPAAELVRARIEQAKNEALTPSVMADRAEGDRDARIAELYALYQERLRTMNAMDFSDLLMNTWILLDSQPEILVRWQRYARMLLVDEYQDTNRVQYLLARMLADSTRNLCVVGDEDQSIYRWRGADIRNILDFERDYPDAKVFKLEQNYRSTKTIIAAAASVIQNNTERKDKTLWTANEIGDPVVYFTGLTEREEADFVAGEIGLLIGDQALRPRDFVVFYRTNSQSRAIEEALVRRRIPYYVVGGTRFYDRREVKDLLSYLRVLANPADFISLERMVGAPSRGIGGKTLEAISALASKQAITPLDAMGRLETISNVALRTAKAASALYTWMRDLGGRMPTMPVREIVAEVAAQSGLAASLDALPDANERKQNLDELLAAASAFDAENTGGGLTEFLERIALVNDTDQIDEAAGRASLMTLHTSKGLEYPIVFIAGMEEGLFPHSRSADSEDEIEEERRLCYVGMTRARRLLYLTNTLSREMFGTRNSSRPSRFLAEIDGALLRRIAPERNRPVLNTPALSERYIDYSDSQLAEDGDGVAVGARVMHPTFGRGVVRRVEGRGSSTKAWVNFDQAGLKLLVLKFANLVPIAE